MKNTIKKGEKTRRPPFQKPEGKMGVKQITKNNQRNDKKQEEKGK